MKAIIRLITGCVHRPVRCGDLTGPTEFQKHQSLNIESPLPLGGDGGGHVHQNQQPGEGTCIQQIHKIPAFAGMTVVKDDGMAVMTRMALYLCNNSNHGIQETKTGGPGGPAVYE